jgi:hypothetical protein
MIGTVSVGIILHEYSHFNDFREFNVTDETLCGLALPIKWENWSTFVHEPAGYYSYRVYINKSDYEEVKKYEQKTKDTEFKAYIISGIIFVFFIFCYWVITFGRYRDKEKILDQEINGLEKDIYIHQLESYVLKHANNFESYDNTRT